MKSVGLEEPDTRGTPVRDIGYLAWRDPQASLEKMSGPVWKGAVLEESTLWDAAVRAEAPTVAEFEKELAAVDIGDITFEPGWNPLTMEGVPGGPAPLKEHFKAYDVSECGKWYWVIRDAHDGAERYDLTAYYDGVVRWIIRDIGPTLALCVGQGRLYYLKTERIHWHYALMSCNAETGDDIAEEFRVKSNQENLEIVRRGEAIFLRVENSGEADLYLIAPLRKGQGPKLLATGGYQIPIGLSRRGKPAYYWRRTGKDIYMPVNTGFHLRSDARPVWGSAAHKLLIVREPAGVVNIHLRGRWFAGGDVAAVTVTVHGTGPVKILLQTPTKKPAVYTIHVDGQHEFRGGEDIPWLTSETREARSEDGAVVSYCVVRARRHAAPEALLVYGYGAYGVPTFNGRVEARWGPLLRRGWAIVYAMIRGGGDSTDAWASAGRLSGRLAAGQDFDAVIRSAQAALGGIPAARTVIAGRSAGGLLVGAAVVRHPEGKLFRGVYAEVPYVDVLRTTTNAGLPLTTVEYNEFGWPAARPVDFATLLKMAPIDALPAEGAPRIYVVCRSGVNDTQVLAYEPMKWIRQLRGAAGGAAGELKLLALREGQGHFYAAAAAVAARAEDLGLLHAWVVRKKNMADKYKLKMANMMRKSRKERKSRKNMAGGKARKATRKATRKAARKGRKATRKGARRN